MNRVGILGAAALFLGAPATAQTAAPAATTGGPVDPARLAAARELIDVLMPPATREQLITGMMTPMLANMRRGMEAAPAFAEMNADPKFRAAFDQFMAKQEARTTAMLREALPGMVPAMAKAYARRFDVAQMRELRQFFETPTGRAYMQASYTIMADPDIQAWQRDLMTRSMARIQADVAAFAEQATKADGKR